LILGLGALLIFVGLLFAIATLSGYDALNMPSEFWAEAAHRDDWQQRALVTETSARRSVLRPPSEATVLLFYEMVNVWRRFFLPALICSVAGVSCFLLTLVMARLDALLAASREAMRPRPDIWIMAAVVLVLLGVFIGSRSQRWGRFPLPVLLICSAAGMLFFLLTLVMARSPGTGAPVPASPAVPSPPAPMHLDIWIIAVIVLLLLGLCIEVYYRARGPRLGLED
jgi:hypothetical protein